MLELTTVRIRNFLSYGNVPTVLELNTYSKTLLQGLNAVGKSAIHLAVTFCLFGKTPRKINLNQLINSINGKDCLIELDFTINGSYYTIKRGLKPAIFEIWKDSVLLDLTGIKDQQRFLETNIIKIDYKTFTTVVTIGGKNYISFMTQPKAERRRIIESLLDIDIFSFMNQIAKSKSSEFQTKIDQEKIAIKITSSEVEFYKDSINKIKTYIEKTKNSNLEKINVYKHKIKEIENKISTVEENLITLQTQFGNLEEIQQSFQDNKNKIVEKKQAGLKKRQLLIKDTNFYKKNNNCPTCTQDINELFKQTTLQKIDQSIVLIDEKLLELDEKLISLNKMNEEIEQHLQSYNKLLNSKNSLLNEKSNNISILNELSLLLSNSDGSEVHNLSEQEVLLAKKYDELLAKKSSLEALIDENDYYDFCQLLLKDEGVKTLIIKEYLPKINSILNKFLEELDLFIDFQFDENFNEIIKSRFRDNFSYESFSDGQKTRIDIALLFTWREIAKLKNSLNINVLFCDEIADSSCDPSATSLIVNLLTNLSKETNVFIISHRSELFESSMSRILQISLVNNFSQIKEIV